MGSPCAFRYGFSYIVFVLATRRAENVIISCVPTSEVSIIIDFVQVRIGMDCNAIRVKISIVEMWWKQMKTCMS